MSVYVPPATSNGGDTCSGGCGTASDVRYTYLQGYFGAHMLSMPSHRYEYITWIVLALVILIIAALHHSRLADQTWLGALWSRWAVKNRVFKLGSKTSSRQPGGNSKDKRSLQEGKSTSRRKVFTFPSFGRTLLLAALVIVPVVLTIVGADYIRPSAGVFDFSESWPNSTISIYTPGLSRRLEWGRGQYPSVTTQSPTITLPYRTWWTAGGRTGAMTNALTPFIVIIALKQIPFALLSTRLLGGLAFDRLSFMHKWGGRVVWLFATAHVALWSVQLAQDQAFGQSMWYIVFMWTKFRWGFVSYGFFTLLILLSIGPMRANYYEIFYVCHVICIIGFMVTAWLHHPPLGAWMYVTLLWWLAERITRAIKVAFINGIGFAGRRPRVIVPSEKHSARNLSVSATSSSTLHNNHLPWQSKPSFGKEQFLETDPHATEGPMGKFQSPERRQTRKSQRYDAVSDVIDGYTSHQQQGMMMQSMESDHQTRYALHDGPSNNQSQFYPEHESEESSSSPPGSSRYCASSDYYSMSAPQNRTNVLPNAASISTLSGPTWNSRIGPRPAMAADVAAIIRPGFAYAQLLSGKTMRLTLRTPNAFSWKPGQYVNLCIPSVRFWQSHPFTIASAYNAGFPSSTAFQEDEVERGLVTKVKGEERTIVLLLRGRRGFTHHLWEYVRLQRERQIRAIEEQTGQQYIRGEVAKTATGVHLRAIIDGPYGSIQRVRWGIHSTVLIICGGSGITSGMAVLEYLCSAMAGNKRVKDFQTQRVRFVWMLREYSHLQWIASAMRRCIELVPPELLQVDLFVTKIQKRSGRMPGHDGMDPGMSSLKLDGMGSGQVGEGGERQFGATQDSSYFGFSNEESYTHQARFTEGDDHEEYDVNAYDLTHFDGEDNSGPSAAESKINERVAKEGKLRRAHTRRATLKRAGKKGGRGGGAAGGGAAAAAHISSLAHQRAIHESNMRPTNAPRQTEMIPERDLGTEQGEDGSRWEPMGDPLSHPESTASYRSPDGLLHPQSHALSSTDNHTSTTMAHSGPTTPMLLSPYPSPRMAPIGLADGRRTPGEYSNSIHGNEYSSTTHLNGARTPMSNYAPTPTPHHYEGGEELEQVQSEVDVPIDLDEGENADLQVIAELARPGYPKLDTILREEVQQSAGRVLVSACGPTTLGNLVRSIASKQINVGEIRKGHLNGHISVVTESFGA